MVVPVIAYVASSVIAAAWGGFSLLKEKEETKQIQEQTEQKKIEAEVKAQEIERQKTLSSSDTSKIVALTPGIGDDFAYFLQKNAVLIGVIIVVGIVATLYLTRK